MSIIQDALQRKAPAEAPGPPPAPPLPQPPAPPLPQPPAPTSFPPPPMPPPSKGKAPSPVLLIVMIAVLLGGAAFFAHRAGLFSRGDGGKDTGNTGPVVGDGQTATSSQTADPKPGETAAPAPDPVDESPADKAAAASRVAALAASAASSEGTTPASTESTNSLAAATNAPPPAPVRPAPVRWPKFTIKGVIAGPAGSGSVILDSALVDVGQSTLDGLRVVRLVEDGVLIEYKGEEQLFRVGSGMP